MNAVISRQARYGLTLLTSPAVTLIMLALTAIYLMPLGYGLVTSLKSEQQITEVGAPILPSLKKTYIYEGETYDLYKVPTEEGIHEWALVNKQREQSEFIDPKQPENGLIHWVGRWRTLDPVWEVAPQTSNYESAWNLIDFPLLLRNTVLYSVVSTFGAVLYGAFVAYGFARFRFPFRNVLFYLVLATIVLPQAVTLLPRYAFFDRIHWVGTWLPIVVPVYFGNGYNIFLLRQFFLTLPRELDEAAMLDGAGPLRIFFSIILPNAKPALIAVALFHFFFAWNDFFEPLIYLAGKPDLAPISVGLTAFQGLYQEQRNLIQSAAVISVIIPLSVFIFAQRFFIQGIDLSGVRK